MSVRDGDRTMCPRWFLIAGVAISLLVVALQIWVASHEWFFGDDFIFLARAQRDPRGWWEIFFPFESRWWWSYRPLSIEVFFWLGTRLFGVSPFPLLVVNVAAHALAALLVARIACQLGFDRCSSLFCGLVLLIMYPSSVEMFWASVFQHLGVRVFFLISVTAFLETLGGGRRRWIAVWCLATVLALMCNELGVLIPGVLVLLALARGSGVGLDRAWRAITMAAPSLAIVSVFAVFRWWVIPPPAMKMPFQYVMAYGPHVYLNAIGYAWLLAHESLWLATAAVALIAAVWVSAWKRSAVLGELARNTALCVAWLVIVMVPFLGFLYAHTRVAMSLEAPAALLLGAHFHAARRLVSARRLSAVDAVALGLVCAALPLAILVDRGRAPQGAVNRDIAQVLSTRTLERGGCVHLRPEESQRWSGDDRFTLNFLTGGLLNALHPRQRHEIFIEGGPKALAGDRACVEIYIGLEPGPRRLFSARVPDSL